MHLGWIIACSDINFKLKMLNFYSSVRDILVYIDETLINIFAIIIENNQMFTLDN